MSNSVLALLILILVGQPLQPPEADMAMPGQALASRVASAAQEATPGRCDEAVARSQRSNAETLFAGWLICHRVGRVDDSVFLILAGQARATADMYEATRSLQPPAEPPAETVDLYGFIYGVAGGAGPSEFYRDVSRTEALFSRLRVWQPTRAPDYDPGWAVSQRMSASEYEQVIREAVEGRVHQLTRLSRLLRDEDYWRLQQEQERLMVENNSTFHEGTPAARRMDEIRVQQAAISRRLGAPER